MAQPDIHQTSYFAGKSALIIGAGQNIGRRIAQEWARRGARITVADISWDGAVETAALLRAAGAQALPVQCDVTDDGSVLAAIDAAEAEFGPLDFHMNNAGLLAGGNPEDLPLSEWQRMFNVNLFGMVRANNVIVPRMIARGRGHIVNTASFAGLYPFAASRIHYAASKAGGAFDVRESCALSDAVWRAGQLFGSRSGDDELARCDAAFLGQLCDARAGQPSFGEIAAGSCRALVGCDGRGADPCADP